MRFGFRKAGGQLGLFAERKPVQKPGSRGGIGYYDRYGHWQYGSRPEGWLLGPPPPPPPPPDPGYVPDLTRYDWVVVNSSGGKDSLAMLDYVVEVADRQGLPRDRIVVLHETLGEDPKRGAHRVGDIALVGRQAAHYGLRFEVVQRDLGLLLDEVEQRGMWPGFGNLRYCTADQKTAQAAKFWTKLTRESEAAGHPHPRILDCLGLRAQEGPGRKEEKKPQFTTRSARSTRVVDGWLPVQRWTDEQVWHRIRSKGLESAQSYEEGARRHSCVFCIYMSFPEAVAQARLHPEKVREFARVEKKIGHQFRSDYSMAEVLAEAERQGFLKAALDSACAYHRAVFLNTAMHAAGWA